MLTRTKRAFTLLELIVVIVIIAILALVAIATYTQVINKAKASGAVQTAQSIDREALALAAFNNAAPTATDPSTGIDYYMEAWQDMGSTAGTAGGSTGTYVGLCTGTSYAPYQNGATLGENAYLVTDNGAFAILESSGVAGQTGTIIGQGTGAGPALGSC